MRRYATPLPTPSQGINMAIFSLDEKTKSGPVNTLMIAELVTG